jgi:hypothetical protein
MAAVHWRPSPLVHGVVYHSARGGMPGNLMRRARGSNPCSCMVELLEIASGATAVRAGFVPDSRSFSRQSPSGESHLKTHTGLQIRDLQITDGVVIRAANSSEVSAARLQCEHIPRPAAALLPFHDGVRILEQISGRRTGGPENPGRAFARLVRRFIRAPRQSLRRRCLAWSHRRGRRHVQLLSPGALEGPH